MQIEVVVRKTINASRATQNKPRNSNPWVTGKGQIPLIPPQPRKTQNPNQKPKTEPNA